MNIIIPAAGRGKRFTDAGYTIPKPYIQSGLSNFSILHLSIANILPICRGKNNRIIVLLQKEWLETYKAENDKIMDWFISLQIEGVYLLFVGIDHITDGPYSTCKLAYPHIDNPDGEMVISACDQFVASPYGLTEWINFTKGRNAVGSLITFCHNGSRWSYVRSDPQHNVLECAEKKVISNFANAGYYYFRSWHDFIYGGTEMEKSGDRTNGEYYVAPIYNYLIRNNQKVVHYFVNEFYSTGTPEDLNVFQEYLKQLRNV